MAQLTERPFPPGHYPLVVVGSGPGALQLSHSLHGLGVEHAVISEDSTPGGMFRRWPLFQRMLSWTKPFAPEAPDSRRFERYDWNSLISDDPRLRGIMTRVMDGTSYFPSRPEMEQGIAEFTREAGVRVRYGCSWETTREESGEFVLGTSDGEYRAPIAVFAVGVAKPWRPSSPGMELASHYADLGSPERFRGHRVFVVGKQNSAFEIANGLLPLARQIVLASPRPAQLSVVTKSLVGVRARYVQPFEDHALGGGVFVLDASIEEISRSGDVFTVRTADSESGRLRMFEVDDVIAATGFETPLRDLPQLGVATFGQSGLPAQTPYWESKTVPNIFFAGTITQGSSGLRKHGIPSNSGAVHGHRYNARVLARHLAERMGSVTERPVVDPASVASRLLTATVASPELWHQRSYLAQVFTFSGEGAVDEGLQPLVHFIEAGGDDAIAITVEANPKGEIYPVAYTRRRGAIAEHELPADPLYEFESDEHRSALEAIVKSSLGSPVA